MRLRCEDLQRTVNAGLSRRDETVKCRPAKPNGIRPQCERFHDVGAAPEAAVNYEGHAAADGRCDLGKYLDRGNTGVELPAAMVGEKDAVAAEIGRALCIRYAEHAFDQQFAWPEI